MDGWRIDGWVGRCLQSSIIIRLFYIHNSYVRNRLQCADFQTKNGNMFILHGIAWLFSKYSEYHAILN